MFNIVLIGSPGAGKGTQSQALIQAYGFTHICPGDILRNEIKAHTPLGFQAKIYMDKGLLVPHDLIVATIKKNIRSAKNTRGILFDGYPRNMLQASTLDQLLTEEFNQSLTLVLLLEVDEQEAKRRIKKRSKLLHRADDQNDAIIAQRMLTYQQSTRSVLDYYKKQQKLISIQGIGPLHEITNSIKKVIDKHLSL